MRINGFSPFVVIPERAPDDHKKHSSLDPKAVHDPYDLDLEVARTNSSLPHNQTWATTNCDDSKTCGGSFNCSASCASNCNC